MSAKGDFKKIQRRAEDQGWRVEKRKEYWLFFPIDKTQPPCRIAGTPSSSRSWVNFLSDLKKRGIKHDHGVPDMDLSGRCAV